MSDLFGLDWIWDKLILFDSKTFKTLDKAPGLLSRDIKIDVLSFPLKIKDESKLYVGYIAISYEIIKERSKDTNFFLEFDKMWIHGYLHLIGYDHKKSSDFNKMLKKEKSILKYFHKVNWLY